DGGGIGAGMILILLVAAWLWLPGLAAFRLGRATIAIAAAVVVALPLSAAIDPGRPLLAYRDWQLLGAREVGFGWNQSYGPLDWPQKGTLLLDIASDGAHYWKATNLDGFDGVRWLRSSSPAPALPYGEPRALQRQSGGPRPDPEWVNRVNVR